MTQTSTGGPTRSSVNPVTSLFRHFVSLPNSGEKNVRRIVVSAESLKQMKDEAKNSKEKPKPVPRSEVFAQLQAGYCGVRQSSILCAYLQAEHEGLLYPRCLVDAV